MRLVGTAVVCLVVGLAVPALSAPVFRHIIIVIQENRTPDNLFGAMPHFEPGVDLATSGVNSLGQTIQLEATPLAGCYDLGHIHPDFEAMLNEGADQETVIGSGCAVPANPEFQYVDNSTGTVQPYFDIARHYGFANRMFQTNQGASFLAHQFLYGATSQPTKDSPLFAADSVKNSGKNIGCMSAPKVLFKVIDGYGNEQSNPAIYPCFEHPVLTDLLDTANISWRYYADSPGSLWTAPNAIQHVCVPVRNATGDDSTCTGTDWTNGDVEATNSAQVLTDIQSCSLASVSWVTPTGEASDHPKSNKGQGPSWVASIVNTLGQQPNCANGENYWNDTAILITWDDWGGWYDHVKPFAVNLQPASPPQWGDGYTYGFRVPLLVVSAYTPNNTVDNTVHDFGSLVYFVEHNFGLGFIGPADTVYGFYADYQAAARGDDLSAFFTRKNPRKFVTIPSTQNASFFIHAPRSSVPVDSD